MLFLSTFLTFYLNIFIFFLLPRLYVHISDFELFNVYTYFRCQWNKEWFPYSDILPECKITDCVKPFKIPEDSFLVVSIFLHSLSICLSIYKYINLTIYQSINLSIYQSNNLSI